MRRREFLMSSAAVGALALGPGAFAQDKLTILGSVPSLGFPFFVHMLNQIKAEAEAQGVNLIESDGQNSAPKQTADIEAAIVQKVNAIVISPLDVNALAPAIEQAIQAGVPVVTIDRRVDGVEGILAHVGADNTKGGEAEAQAMVDAFPNGAKLFHLQGQPGAGPAIDRNKGVHNVLDPIKDKYQIIFEQTANFARAEALSVTEAGLAANGKPDAIICANDDMALGAIEACAAARLQRREDLRLRRAARGDRRGPRRHARRHGRAVPGRAVAHGRPHRGGLRQGQDRAQGEDRPADADRDRQGQSRQGRAHRRDEVVRPSRSGRPIRWAGRRLPA